MKTIEDLKKITPTVINQLMNDEYMEFGGLCPDYDSFGGCWSTEFRDNNFLYEDDGWLIYIDYKCAEHHGKAFGETTDISISHYDEDADEESIFTDEDCKFLRDAVDKALKSF